ncbi:MAG: hypothetical protein FJ148_20070 [Deltaproteobacteria bacterium]|nr:hypothetical protein [Deltaproteobacteria bacterium]
MRDLSHELGNYFHKLYYWTDCVRSGTSDLEAGVSPTGELDRTLHRLQAFLNLALVYFEPAVADRVAVRGADVAKAFEAILRGESPDAVVEIACTAAASDARVQVDTRRLSTGFRTIAVLLGAGAGTILRLEVDTVASGKRSELLQLAVSATGGSPEAAARRAQRLVEWAVAARMLELNGGELRTNEQRPGSARCVLTLPLAE